MKAGSSFGNPVEVPRLALAASVTWDSSSAEVMTLLSCQGKKMLIMIQYFLLFLCLTGITKHGIGGEKERVTYK